MKEKLIFAKSCAIVSIVRAVKDVYASTCIGYQRNTDTHLLVTVHLERNLLHVMFITHTACWFANKDTNYTHIHLTDTCTH